MHALLAALTILTCDPDTLVYGGYPVTFMYSQIKTNGQPFRSGTTLDSAGIEMQSRWDIVTLDVVGNRGSVSAGDNRPVVRLTRTYNPSIRLLAFSAGATMFKCATGWWWDYTSNPASPPVGDRFDWDNSGSPDATYFPAGCDTEGTDFSWARLRAARQNNAMLYSQRRDRNNDGRRDAFCQGSDANGHCNATPLIDFSISGVAQALADTIATWAQELSGVYNGVFVDEQCTSIAFLTDGGGEDSVMIRLSSCPGCVTRADSLTAWDNAYKAGIATFWSRLRSQLPASWTIYGNCGPFGARGNNGWMREVWPDQNGGTWETNMLGWSASAGDVGYLGDALQYAAPVSCLLTLQRASVSTDSLDLTAQRRLRWVFGSATLGEGAGSITRTTLDPLRGYLPWWADEYAVTPAGNSTPDKRYKGWLGAPLGRYFTTTGGGYRRNFKGGTVLVNPTGGNVTFTLEQGYYRLNGITARTINFGGAATSVTVQSHDAVFLQLRPPWR